jgi:hypothetical protein
VNQEGGLFHQSFSGNFFRCTLHSTTHKNQMIAQSLLRMELKSLQATSFLIFPLGKWIWNGEVTDQLGIYLCISMLLQFLLDKLNSISTASGNGMWVFQLYLNKRWKWQPLGCIIFKGHEQSIQQQQCVLPDFLEEIPDPK